MVSEQVFGDSNSQRTKGGKLLRQLVKVRRVVVVGILGMHRRCLAPIAMPGFRRLWSSPGRTSPERLDKSPGRHVLAFHNFEVIGLLSSSRTWDMRGMRGSCIFLAVQHASQMRHLS